MKLNTLTDYLASKDAWRVIPPHFLATTNAPGRRSPEALNACLDQFQVHSAARYQPRDGLTYCNVFAGDVTLALRAELPHWVDKVTNAPSFPGQPGAVETRANDLHDALVAGRYGYVACGPEHALAKALVGMPVVAVWHNAGGPGHIAVVEPAADPRGILVAQAGAVCARRVPVAVAFGLARHPERVVRFFWAW